MRFLLLTLLGLSLAACEGFQTRQPLPNPNDARSYRPITPERPLPTETASPLPPTPAPAMPAAGTPSTPSTPPPPAPLPDNLPR